MKSQTRMLGLLLAIMPAASASAQVLPLGQVPMRGEVQQVSCASCDSCSGGCGAAWGTEFCDIQPGLFPPCPNPCRTTLLADFVGDVKMAVDTSLSNLFCCVLGMGQQLACGCVNSCSCGAPGYGYGVAEYGCGAPSGCDCGMCNGGMVGSPTPAMMMPTDQPPTVPDAGQPNPFGDDPQPSVQPIPNGATSRSVVPPRRPTSVVNRPHATGSVRRVSHQQSLATPAPQRIQSPVEARPIQTRSQAHYTPRRAASIRTSNGQQLQKTPIQSKAPQSSIRFR